MSGITGMASATMAESAAKGWDTGMAVRNTVAEDEQFAFIESTPAQKIIQTQDLPVSETFGDHILAGLGKINSAFSSLDALAPRLTLPGAFSPSLDPSANIGSEISPQPPLSALAPHTPGAQDTPFDKVEQESIAMYNRSLSLQMAFENSEFETHIITVSSQNMSSTLKNLLTQGG